MIDLPSDMYDYNKLIQWLIDNPNEYSVYTYDYIYDSMTYQQYYFILNAGYETYITTQEFVSTSTYMYYFINKSGTKDKNYLTIMPTDSADYFGVTFGSNYEDVRLVICFSPKAGQIFTITDGKLTNYTPASGGTGLSKDPELKDFTINGKQYSCTGYSVYNNFDYVHNTETGYVHKIHDVHQYRAKNIGLCKQLLGSIEGVLVSNTDIAIGKYIKVPLNTANKLLAYDRDAKNTVYDVASHNANVYTDDIITTYTTADNTVYARLDTSETYGYRKLFKKKFELYDLNTYSTHLGQYLGDSTEPGIDIEDFVSITTEDMNNAIVNSGAQNFRELVNNLSLKRWNNSYSTYDVEIYWMEAILNIIANAVPSLINILPKISQVTTMSEYPVLNATVYDSSNNSTVVYEDFLNSHFSSDDFIIRITLDGSISLTINTSSRSLGILKILTLLGFFRPNSTKSVTITKG